MSEYLGIQSVHEIVCFIEEHPDLAGKAIEENYSGCYKFLADYAVELTKDICQIPENVAY